MRGPDLISVYFVLRLFKLLTCVTEFLVVEVFLSSCYNFVILNSCFVTQLVFIFSLRRLKYIHSTPFDFFVELLTFNPHSCWIVKLQIWKYDSGNYRKQMSN